MRDDDDEIVLPSQIVRAGAPILRQPCPPLEVDAWPREKIERLCQLMLKTMSASHGVGLAANQVGLSVRVIALGDRAQPPPGINADLYERQGRSPFEPYVIINPVLCPRNAVGWSAWFEGCLSFPGYTGAVSRWNEVEVEGLAPDGTPISLVAKGWHARILQHEVDHLNGSLYMDRIHPRTLMHKSEYANNWRSLDMQATLRGLEANPVAPSM